MVVNHSCELLFNLRNATSDLHKKIEETAIISSLIEGDMHIESYILFMQVLAVIYKRYELNARDLLVKNDFYFVKLWPEVTPLIESDCRKIQPNFIPQTIEDNNLECLATAFGQMYVLEGALIGRQVIAKKIIENTSWISDYNLEFHLWDREACGKRWNDFLFALNQVNLSSDQVDISRQSSVLVFNDLLRLLKRIDGVH